MANTIYNTDDTIDSRDVIARREELESERENLVDDLNEAKSAEPSCPDDADEVDRLDAEVDEATDALEQWDVDNGTELANLTALCEQAEGYAEDWEHGAQLIRDSYFKTYAMEFADDIGALEGIGDKWPCTCIDWDQAARELQMDYTSVEFDGVTYWVR